MHALSAFGAKNSLFEKNDHFTKTGSTNIGKTKNRRRFVQACVGMTSLSCLMAGWCTQR